MIVTSGRSTLCTTYPSHVAGPQSTSTTVSRSSSSRTTSDCPVVQCSFLPVIASAPRSSAPTLSSLKTDRPPSMPTQGPPRCRCQRPVPVCRRPASTRARVADRHQLDARICLDSCQVVPSAARTPVSPPGAGEQLVRFSPSADTGSSTSASTTSSRDISVGEKCRDPSAYPRPPLQQEQCLNARESLRRCRPPAPRPRATSRTKSPRRADDGGGPGDDHRQRRRNGLDEGFERLRPAQSRNPPLSTPPSRRPCRRPDRTSSSTCGPCRAAAVMPSACHRRPSRTST